jgi:malonate-semialdehyde dehydrogenase (acetylating) / methylmalonate-semialdehyde dehydrogenase
MRTIQNAIDGRKITSASRRIVPIYNPATGEQTAELPFSTLDDVHSAVAATKKAAVGWGTSPPLKGKTHADARGELACGIDVVVFACGKAVALRRSLRLRP